MFTGIITDVGHITDIHYTPDMIITLQTRYDCDAINLGASVACNGICLTVTHKTHNTLKFCLSNETQSKTTAKNWHIGQKLNLESALKMGDELGGHFVTGHVDCIARIISITPDGESLDIKIQCPTDIMPFIAKKGAVCCDGISLTVNNVYDTFFHVNIIPHTIENTNWQFLQTDDSVNLEIDMFARYIARYNTSIEHKI